MHDIDALLLRGPFDKSKARDFDLDPIALDFEITLFPLDESYCDYWSRKLGVPGRVSERPGANRKVIHHMARLIAHDPLFAVISTAYFGGLAPGEHQSAAVYQGDIEIMQPTSAAAGPINEALKLLGVVVKQPYDDEFDTIGLGRFRSFDDLFKKYWDTF